MSPIVTQLQQWQMDEAAQAAAAAYPEVISGQLTLEQVTRDEGAEVAGLVAALIELTELESLPQMDEDSVRREATLENLRKLLLVTSGDLRVMLIKLAEILVRLREAVEQGSDDAELGRAGLEIYATLANRLGMGQLKAEMEDLAFKLALPEEYARIVGLTAEVMADADDYMASWQERLRRELAAVGLDVISLEGRRKHLYSIYQKLGKTDGSLDKIYDLVALRLIVSDVTACYQALGVIHQHYKPLIYRIKDYIAVPKPNGYQSLHTTVFGPEGRISELQLRTPEMHEAAERGLAAHFHYDALKQTDHYKAGQVAAVPRALGWATQLAALREAHEDSAATELALDLFRDRIFVLSPRGDIYDLPEGATPIDFAFAIHGELGLRMAGAKVNGRLVPLTSKLDNRDVVEVLTRREPAPNRAWLAVVQTAAARQRIRAWFRAQGRDDNIAAGRAAVESELGVWDYHHLDDVPVAQTAAMMDSLHLRDTEALYLAVGEGNVSVAQVMRRLFPRPTPETMDEVATGVERAQAPMRPQGQPSLLIGGEAMAWTLASCCQPQYPEDVIGYITRGRGVTIHSPHCPNLPSDPERLIQAQWDGGAVRPNRLSRRLRIESANRVGLLRDITTIISARGYNIRSHRSEVDDATVHSIIELGVELPDEFALASLLRYLGHVPGVIRAQSLVATA